MQHGHAGVACGVGPSSWLMMEQCKVRWHPSVALRETDFGQALLARLSICCLSWLRCSSNVVSCQAEWTSAQCKCQPGRHALNICSPSWLRCKQNISTLGLSWCWCWCWSGCRWPRHPLDGWAGAGPTKRRRPSSHRESCRASIDSVTVTGTLLLAAAAGSGSSLLGSCGWWEAGFTRSFSVAHAHSICTLYSPAGTACKASHVTRATLASRQSL